MNIKKKIKSNVSLKQYTTFKIGGKTRYFLEARNKEEIVVGVKWAKQNNLPFFILGGGSNLLVRDEEYRGLVIKMKNEKCKMKNGNLKFKIIESDAGVELSELVKLCAKQGLDGFEWASGIPKATVGGALFINAGAFGSSIAENVERVEVFDTKENKLKTLTFEQCEFGYKDSIFKKNKNLVIISVLFKLEKKDKAEIKKEIARVLDYRKTHHPMRFASAGSIFKNCLFCSRANGERLQNRAPSTKFNFSAGPQNPDGIIPAAYLIEKCGLGGKQIGKAKISEQHCNFIINLGGASFNDVKSLIDLAEEKVKQKFGVELEEEVQEIV